MKKIVILLVCLPAVLLQSGTAPEKEAYLSEDIGDMTSLILAEHNTCRQNTSSELTDLQWDANLAAFAQQYANELIRNNPVRLTHSTHDDRSGITGWEGQWIGENLGYGMNSTWNLNTSETDLETAIRQSIQSWCDEKQYYNRSTNTCNAPSGQSCGHFTQAVWQETTSVGCAIAASSDGTQYVLVCNYGPGGNLTGVAPYGGERPRQE